MNKVTNTAGLETVNGIPMMSSRSISEMTGKDHGSIVIRDIKNMIEQLGIYPANLQVSESNEFFFKMKTYKGREVIDEILLDQDLSTTLVTGYSVQDRYKIVKRWSDLESGKATPLIAEQPTSQAPDLFLLARVVSEAAVSAAMKAVMEVTGINAVTAQSVALPAAPAVEPAVTSDEFVPVHKVSWATGLSDATCRRLITFSALPAKHIEGIRGLCVNREAFIAAAKTLIDESTPPQGKRKRWQNPEFGGFVLRKDPRQTFGKGE
ncbi:Rha family transcriptional regulator [Enterobacter ludwigii]|uniref:Rha family transcriptional regulator n=1 Tax=Enterobacter ludwigii TaxID=299767 RepID=UPI003BEED515